MTTEPFLKLIDSSSHIPDSWDNHIERRLSSMKGQFSNTEAFDDLLSRDDKLLYEVYEFKAAEVAGELLSGISVVKSGLVGDEYYMTKGHFHSVIDTAEVYYCLSGRGMMVMENPEGDCSVRELHPGVLLYVAPRWAHRSVNIDSAQELITLFAYPGNAGHDYGTIEKRGFRKIVVDRDGDPTVVDNPKWREYE